MKNSCLATPYYTIEPAEHESHEQDPYVKFQSMRTKKQSKLGEIKTFNKRTGNVHGEPTAFDPHYNTKWGYACLFEPNVVSDIDPR